MIEFTAEQMAILDRLRARGFSFVAFPLYASKIGVRKGNCAVLLDPVPGGMRVFGEASFLVNGNLSVKVTRGRETHFVWKKDRLPASPERMEELQRFTGELEELLLASA